MVRMPKPETQFALPFAAVALAVSLALAGCSADASASQDTEAAQDDVSLLLSSLDDEYKSEATYEAMLAKFGEDTRPFSNIIRAEQRHSDAAKAQLDRLGADYPDANPYIGTIEAPETRLEACQAGITAEELNIALYDRLLPNVQDEEVRSVLEHLQFASREHHLPAFQRCVERGGTMGAGGGMGQGGGMGHGEGGGMGHRGEGMGRGGGMGHGGESADDGS